MCLVYSLHPTVASLAVFDGAGCNCFDSSHIMAVAKIMLRSSTLKIMLYLLIGYFLLWAPSLFWPKYLDSPLGVIAVIPVLSVYVFHNLGIPGLLYNNGACGWSWCAPTILGWLFIVSFWLFLLWLLASFIARLKIRSVNARDRDS